ncbi:MAG: S9 family peptidase [Chloroflexota bacterium]
MHRKSQNQYITLDDMRKLVGLSEPQLSPDGRTIALLVARPNYDENRHEKTLTLIEIATQKQYALTHNRPHVSFPRWSPSGDAIAFLDKTTEPDSKPQLFVLPMQGGEAQCVTQAAQGVNTFEWHPNGKTIAFVTADEPAVQEGEERHNKSFEVGDHNYLATSAPQPTRLWMVAADGSTPAQRLTSGTECVATFSARDQSTFVWTPAGDALVFVSQTKPHTGEVGRSSLKLVHTETGEISTIIEGPLCLTSPLFSPDGQQFAYARPHDNQPMLYTPHGIYIRPTSALMDKDHTDVCITNAIDRTFYGQLWMPDSESVLVDGCDWTRVSLWVQPLVGEPERLQLGGIHPTLGEISVGQDGAIAFIGSRPQQPDELYYLPSSDAPPEQLTHFHQAFDDIDFGRVASLRWRSAGFEADGVLIYPPTFKKGRTYPMVLVVHGGPMNASTEAFHFLGQLMAAQGWLVFSPNYRGSSNLGRVYQSAVINDAGAGPGDDVMAGLAVINRLGVVDKEQIAISGWSYGGYMTAWLTSQYDGWRAAVAGAPLTDYIDSYCLSDINVIFGGGFHQSPYHSTKSYSNWHAQSPIAHAHKITTPTLILCNTGDLRVPITQSYQLYHALKDNGVETQFIAYPISGHSPQDPVHQRDRYRRWVEWIEKHFEA